jgi:hypothetical protein
MCMCVNIYINIFQQGVNALITEAHIYQAIYNVYHECNKGWISLIYSKVIQCVKNTLELSVEKQVKGIYRREKCMFKFTSNRRNIN